MLLGNIGSSIIVKLMDNSVATSAIPYVHAGIQFYYPAPLTEENESNSPITVTWLPDEKANT
jgi:hypothetical protein